MPFLVEAIFESKLHPVPKKNVEEKAVSTGVCPYMLVVTLYFATFQYAHSNQYVLTFFHANSDFCSDAVLGTWEPGEWGKWARLLSVGEDAKCPQNT